MDEMTLLASDPGYFSAEAFQVVKTKLGDEKILEREVSSRYISNLSFWWASAGTEYYTGYRDQLEKVTHQDLVDYLKSDVLDKPVLMSLRMSPAGFDRDAAEAAGYTEITNENAYWWTGE